MNPKTAAIYAACGLLGLLVLCVLDAPPAAPVNTVSTPHLTTTKEPADSNRPSQDRSAKAWTANPYIRAALSNALLRVRADLAQATNAAEIANLRAAEQSITNALK
jgi:hypothetical protein